MTRLVAALFVLGIGCAAPAYADMPSQASAEAAVRSLYTQVQAGCTPTMPSSFQSITWDFFTSTPDGEGHIGGTGRIRDANLSLGGPFVAMWDTGGPAEPGARKVGPWDVILEFC
jgi:hypothetical protein